MKHSGKSPTVAELRRTLNKMGVVNKSSDTKTVLKSRLTKAKNAKKSPKKSPKKRCKSGQYRSRSSGRCRKRSSPKRSRSKPKTECRDGYSRNKASGYRCAKDGSNKLKSIKEVKDAVKEAYFEKYGVTPKLGGKSKGQAIAMLARIQKCPESGKVWDSVSQTCRDRKFRAEIGSKAVEKLEKLALDANNAILKHSNDILKLEQQLKFTEERAELAKKKADINKREKQALAELDKKAEESKKILMKGIVSKVKEESEE